MSFADAIRIMLVPGWQAPSVGPARHHVLPDPARRGRHALPAVVKAAPEPGSPALPMAGQGGGAAHAPGRGTRILARMDGPADPATPLCPAPP